MNNKQKTRAEIPNEFKWSLDKMYASDALFLEDINQGLDEAKIFADLKGTIMDSSDSLLKALNLYSSSVRKLEKAYAYSHMRHDEDNADSKYMELYSKAVSAITEFSALTSFLTPELLSSDIELVRKYIESNDELKLYSFMLEEIMLQKEHTLTTDQEYILASLGEIIGSPDEIFGVLNDADFNFGNVETESGSLPLTHASFIQFLESNNRDTRKDAYNKLYEKYKEYNNTISTIYNYNVKADVTVSKLRNYNSSLNMALSANKIPEDVYTNLISSVHKHLPSMHKYVGLRKKYLQLDELKMYDVYKPLVKPEGIKYTYEEAVNIACEALKPLGDEYISILRNGLLNEKWVDIYENKGKTSGAYSFGSYDSYPYILMNFTGELRDIFTLVHEGGHSMHSYYTRHNQPYIYGDYPIFTAEVASTVNETLLIKYLLDNCDSDQMKSYLINFYIDEFKGTLFRQTMFAEFELATHNAIENGEALTPDVLNSLYNELNNQYFGPQLSKDDMIQYEWSRIPHFYRSFYVYQYATGYSAANAIANRILKYGESARNDYIKFLSSGSSNYPIELLKIAGVNMASEEPVLSALDTFDSLVDELEKILEG